MDTSVFVVSDLHLGGRQGFEMCSALGRSRLADFIGHATKQRTSDRDVRLVVNGDIVDFLAETDHAGRGAGFTEDETLALYKLGNILEHTGNVWKALRDFVQAGCGLTLLLGNHDVELSLPRVRERFMRELGNGRTEFVYDNQALKLGELVVEHGNRYDAWNVVPHDTLRRIRSQLSRGEKPPRYPVQPGSMLVVEVMNGIKARYPWVDLLKPETEGLLKLLRALGAIAGRDVVKGLRQSARMAERWVQFDADGLPTDEEYVNAVSSRRGHASLEHELAATAANSRDELDELLQAAKLELESPALLKAFRRRAEKDGTTFHVDIESETYLRPARTLAKQARVVVFGHTHLAKSIDLGAGKTYLNTGTWADLIRVPESVYTGTDKQALDDLARFVEALRTNEIAKLRRQVPTYARIELGADDAIREAGVYFFDGADKPAVPLSTDEMLARIEAEG